MVEVFKTNIKQNDLLQDGDVILLALSGGIDSMVMADLFIKSGFSCAVAHCNFQLRGIESNRDEEFIHKYARQHNLPYHSVRFDTEQYADEKGISIQMAARDLRYRFFEETMDNYGYQKVAIGHNSDDNAETMIINLVRGTGLRGLSGISVKSGRIIRPMIVFTRDEISDYCRTESLEFREDHSNSETKYIRNKIRHNVLPVLKEINPSILSTLASTGEFMSDYRILIENYSEEIRKECIRQAGDHYVAEIRTIRNHSGNKALIYEIFRPFGLKGTGLNDLINILYGNNSSFVVTATHRIVKNRNQLLIIPLKQENDQIRIILSDIDKLKECIYFRSAMIIADVRGFLIPGNKNYAAIDLDALTFPLIIRNWLHGDMFEPFGMRGRKKVSDYFTDRKYSAKQKENALILESDGRIVWIIGERIDNRFRVTGKTRKILLLEVNEDRLPCLQG